MRARVYLQYDYVSDRDTVVLSEDEYIRLLDEKYGGAFENINSVGRPVVNVGGDAGTVGTSWAPCEADLFNDKMRPMTVDEIVSHCVTFESVTCVIKPDIEKMDPFFEEEYNAWVNGSESARKASLGLPIVDIAVSFRNLAGNIVWAMMEGCTVFGLVNRGDVIVNVRGMRFIDEITNIHKDTDG